MFRSEPFRSAFNVLLAAVLAAQIGCSSMAHARQAENDRSGLNETMKRDTIKLAVEVSFFKPEAMHDDFVDGTSASYGLTVLTIVEPGKYAGKRLRILHTKTPPNDSIWVKVGQRCVVEVEEWLLNDPGTLVPPEKVSVIVE